MHDQLIHVVLVKFREEVPTERRWDAKAWMARLGAECGGEGAGIVDWKADWNLDRRKGYDLMSVAVFASQEAFERFRVHSAHRDFASEMSGIADWIVGDMPWMPG